MPLPVHELVEHHAHLDVEDPELEVLVVIDDDLWIEQGPELLVLRGPQEEDVDEALVKIIDSALFVEATGKGVGTVKLLELIPNSSISASPVVARA